MLQMAQIKNQVQLLEHMHSAQKVVALLSPST
jgi:hypothetical protein